MAEDEPERLVEAEKLLLLAHDAFEGRVGVLRVLTKPRVLRDALGTRGEVSVMDRTHLGHGQHSELRVGLDGGVDLLEPRPKLASRRVIIGYAVNEEQRQRLERRRDSLAALLQLRLQLLLEVAF